MLSVARSGPSPQRQTIAPSGLPFGKASNGLRADLLVLRLPRHPAVLAPSSHRNSAVEVFSHVIAADGGAELRMRVGVGVGVARRAIGVAAVRTSSVGGKVSGSASLRCD